MTGTVPVPVETAKGHAFPEAARRLFGNVRLDFPNGKQDRSRLRSVMLGACRLSRLEAPEHTVAGDDVAAGPDDPDSIKLIVQSAGNSVLSQCGRAVEVGGRHIVLYDPTRPYLLANHTAVRLLLLQMPRAAFGAAFLQRLKEPFPVPARAAGLNQVLTSMMASTFSEIDRLDEAVRRALGETMLGLARSMTGAGDGDTRLAPLELLFRRIEMHIAENITDPGLDVHSIARRMGCSERYIYRAFETRQTTPSDYIWSLRIERASEKLHVMPDRPGMISQIAFDLGFSSSAHFARVFRNRFGMTPSDWRRAGGPEKAPA